MKVKISIGWDKCDLAPLIKTLPGKDELLPACVCLGDHGTVWAESYTRLAPQSPEDTDYGRVLRWEVNPRIRGDVLASTLHDLRPAFQRLLDGLDYVMAGRCLYLEFNEEAQDADNEIIDTLYLVSNNPSNLVDVRYY